MMLHVGGRSGYRVDGTRAVGQTVVRMEWCGGGEVTRTLCIAGKGVTYDVGGADIKVGGSMAGMRRDKCGAAAAAGFVLACARAEPALTEGLQ